MSETKKTQRDMLGEIVIREWRQQNRDWAERAGEAVAAHVRAEDAARGGTLPPEHMAAVESSLRNKPELTWNTIAVGKLYAHAGAQGRTIAALEEQVRTLTAERDAAKDSAREWERLRGEAYTLYREAGEERDALRARVAELEQRQVEDAGRVADRAAIAREALEQRATAESALATLRQAVDALESALNTFLPEERREWSLLYHRERCACLSDEEADCDCGGTEQGRLVDRARSAKRACDATPAPEHPDTAALRALQREVAYSVAMMLIHESTKDRLVRALKDSGATVVAALGASGPSGGGEAKRDLLSGRTCQRCLMTTEHGASCHNCDATPTTPPDVAATEHPVAVAAREAMVRGGEKLAAGGMDSPTPTPEEDWTLVRRALVNAHDALKDDEECDGVAMQVDEALAAIARLREAPRRAAEAMRERCAQQCELHPCQQACQHQSCSGARWMAKVIRAIPLP